MSRFTCSSTGLCQEIHRHFFLIAAGSVNKGNPHLATWLIQEANYSMAINIAFDLHPTAHQRNAL